MVVYTNLRKVIERNVSDVGLALLNAAVKVLYGLPQGVEFKLSLHGDSVNAEPVHIRVMAAFLGPYVRVVLLGRSAAEDALERAFAFSEVA